MRTHRIRLALSLGGVLIFAPAASGTERPKSVPVAEAPREVLRAVSPQAWFVENHVRSGLDGSLEGHLLVEVQLETRHGFQVYEDKTDFWSEGDENLGGRLWKVEVVERPKAFEFFDPVTKTLKSGYRGQALFKLRLGVPEAPQGGPIQGRLDPGHPLPLVAGFQACNDQLCLFPAAIRLDLAMPGSNTSAPGPGFLDRALGRLSASLSQGGEIGLGTVLVLLLAGLVTAFTPCVYPLYPITIGMFTRWSQKSHASPLGLALAYCGGLTLSYASLGLASAATGAVFGSLTQKPPFLIGVGLVMLLSAAAFSGLFEIRMPAFLNRALGGPDVSEIVALRGALFGKAAAMGAGLGIVASPCVGPVLVALLAWLSTRLQGGGSAYITGFALLAVFGVGMSLPFLALGHLIVRMHRRPSLGRLTPWFKHLGTILMVAGSMLFLFPGVKLALRDPEHGVERRYPVKSLENWSKTVPAVLDFRADWCTACLQLEAETYPRPEVSSLFESGAYEFVEIDLTESTPVNEAIAREFGVRSLPTVLIARAGGEICAKLTLYGFEPAPAFRARLDRAQRDCY